MLKELLADALRGLSVRTCDDRADTGALFVSRPEGVEIESIEHLLPNPQRARTNAHHSTIASFVQYVAAHKRPNSAIYVAEELKPGQAIAVAIIDDHAPTSALDGVAGWGDFRATAFASVSPEYALLTQFDGKAFDQSEFARALRDIARFAVKPQAAELLEIVRSISLSTKGRFQSATDEASGSVNFAFEHKVSAQAGTETKRIKVPETFTFRMPILAGGEPVDILAEFFYRTPNEAGGEVKLGLRLANRRWDEAAAVEGVVEKLAGLALPIYRSKGGAAAGMTQAAK